MRILDTFSHTKYLISSQRCVGNYLKLHLELGLFAAMIHFLAEDIKSRRDDFVWRPVKRFSSALISIREIPVVDDPRCDARCCTPREKTALEKKLADLVSLMGDGLVRSIIAQQRASSGDMQRPGRIMRCEEFVGVDSLTCAIFQAGGMQDRWQV